MPEKTECHYSQVITISIVQSSTVGCIAFFVWPLGEPDHRPRIDAESRDENRFELWRYPRGQATLERHEDRRWIQGDDLQRRGATDADGREYQDLAAKTTDAIALELTGHLTAYLFG